MVGVMRRGCNSTAVQRSGGLAEQKTRRARVWAALMEGWEGRRGSAAFKERRAEDFGVGAG